MRYGNVVRSAVLLLLAPTLAPAQQFAFIDVTVLPMDGPRILEHQTVVVSDGVIREVGPAAKVRVPAGATRVDGRGKFLMPGLAEMHAHVPGGNASAQAVEDVLFLYLANGITTARSMLGAPPHLVLRDRLARGEVVGPTLIAGAPSLNGNSAPDAAAARAAVAAHKEAGYDFLKLHPGLTREAYDAIVEASRAAGITFAGHVSQAVGLEHTLASRQSTIDHLDGYVEAVTADSVRERMRSGPVELGAAMRSVTDERIRAVARATRQAGVYNVPTAALWESLFGARTSEEMMAWPEMRYVSQQQRNAWAQQKANMLQNDAQHGTTAEERAAFLQVRRRILRALADEGAPLLMGTDAPQMFSVPGFSLHREFALMSEIGIPPYTILESGTRNVAAYARLLGLDSRFGTVAPGNRADLLLLEANPLEDVGNLADIAGVMARGRWVNREEIQRGLAEIAARAAGS